MSVITAQSLVDKAAFVLNDAAATRWTEVELLAWLNEGVRELVRIAPSVNTVTAAIPLVGGTRQTIPAQGYVLIDIICNSSAGVKGDAVRKTDRAILDAMAPGWHAYTETAVVKSFMYDPQDPTVFYVYPPHLTASPKDVVAVYSLPPADILITDVIPINDVFAGKILDYMLYRAFSKEAEFTKGDTSRADKHFAMFKAK